LKRLEVKTKEMDLTFQAAEKIIDLVQKVEKIKDPHVREKVREALSINVIASIGPLKLPPSLPKPETTVEHEPATNPKAETKKITKGVQRTSRRAR
jgi:hypothetical protein